MEEADPKPGETGPFGVPGWDAFQGSTETGHFFKMVVCARLSIASVEEISRFLAIYW
jgi:hypothetical protein